MSDTIKLTGFSEAEGGGQIDLEFLWNGNAYSHSYPNRAALVAAGASMVTSPEGVAQFIAGFWYSKDNDMEDSGDVLNKVLHLDPDGDPVAITTLGPNPSLCWTKGLIA